MWLGSHKPAFGFLLGPLAAFVSGLVVRTLAIANVLPRGCMGGTELACIITLAPGISLALASFELASRNPVSGSARLIAALAVSFLIGLGLAFGEEVAGFYDPAPVSAVVAPCPALTQWWLFLSFPVVVASFIVLLDGPPRRWILMVVPVRCLEYACSPRFPPQAFVAAVAFFVSYGLAFTPLSASIQTLLASGVIGVLGFCYSALTGLPSSSVVYAGIVYLVPGGLSIRSFYGVIAGVNGLQFGVSFLTVAVSVALGILIASVPANFSTKPVAHKVYSGANSLI